MLCINSCCGTGHISLGNMLYMNAVYCRVNNGRRRRTIYIYALIRESGIKTKYMKFTKYISTCAYDGNITNWAGGWWGI